MFGRFGEVEAESSRAFMDDDDEDYEAAILTANGSASKESQPRTVIQDQDYFESRIVQDGPGYKLFFLDDDDSGGAEDTANYGLEIETYVGEAYETFIQENKKTPASQLLCVFDGRVPVGFGKGYLGEGSVSLAKIFYTGSQGTVDSLLVRPKAKLVVEIVKVGENLMFALIDTYAVPSGTINFILSELQVFIGASHRVVIFHSEGLANFRSEPDGIIESKIFYIRNEFFSKTEIPAPAKRCPYPNLLSGVSGAILTDCQQNHKKPCVALVNYTPSETVDQFTLKPYFDIVRGAQNTTPKNFHISTYFSGLKFNLASTGSSIPSHISRSNLYT